MFYKNELLLYYVLHTHIPNAHTLKPSNYLLK